MLVWEGILHVGTTGKLRASNGPAVCKMSLFQLPFWILFMYSQSSAYSQATPGLMNMCVTTSLLRANCVKYMYVFDCHPFFYLLGILKVHLFQLRLLLHKGIGAITAGPTMA